MKSLCISKTRPVFTFEQLKKYNKIDLLAECGTSNPPPPSSNPNPFSSNEPDAYYAFPKIQICPELQGLLNSENNYKSHHKKYMNYREVLLKSIYTTDEENLKNRQWQINTTKTNNKNNSHINTTDRTNINTIDSKTQQCECPTTTTSLPFSGVNIFEEMGQLFFQQMMRTCMGNMGGMGGQMKPQSHNSQPCQPGLPCQPHQPSLPSKNLQPSLPSHNLQPIHSSPPIQPSNSKPPSQDIHFSSPHLQSYQPQTLSQPSQPGQPSPPSQNLQSYQPQPHSEPCQPCQPCQPPFPPQNSQPRQPGQPPLYSQYSKSYQPPLPSQHLQLNQPKLINQSSQPHLPPLSPQHLNSIEQSGKSQPTSYPPPSTHENANKKTNNDTSGTSKPKEETAIEHSLCNTVNDCQDLLLSLLNEKLARDESFLEEICHQLLSYSCSEPHLSSPQPVLCENSSRANKQHSFLRCCPPPQSNNSENSKISQKSKINPSSHKTPEPSYKENQYYEGNPETPTHQSLSERSLNSMKSNSNKQNEPSIQDEYESENEQSYASEPLPKSIKST